MRQIDDWRDRIENNLDYARRPKAENGLGLPGISGTAEALILIGVAEQRHEAFQGFRRRAVVEKHLSIHSYSWLLGVLFGQQDPLFGPLDSETAELDF